MLCGQSCSALEEMSSFLTLIQLSHFFTPVTLWVPHIIVSHASDLKHWSLAFSVIEADFLPYFSYSSHFAVSSPLTTQGISHLLSAWDISLCCLRGDRSRYCWPCPQREVNPMSYVRKRKGWFEVKNSSISREGAGGTSSPWQHDWVTDGFFTIGEEVV